MIIYIHILLILSVKFRRLYVLAIQYKITTNVQLVTIQMTPTGGSPTCSGVLCNLMQDLLLVENLCRTGFFVKSIIYAIALEGSESMNLSHIEYMSLFILSVDLA